MSMDASSSAPVRYPDARGRYGEFGGRYVAETLMRPLMELEQAFSEAIADEAFMAEFREYLRETVGRPTPVTFARNLSRELGGARIYLKREDLCHTGAHKINNTLGQCLLARRMGKRAIIAETGAGQHGVATATAAALLGMPCRIFMGRVDCERQTINVLRMRLLGAEVHFAPHSGPFARGTHATIFATLDRSVTAEEVRVAAPEVYVGSPFVTVLDGEPRLKDVVGTNRCHLGYAARGREVVAFAVIDNLLQGAAGGAVQWMNRLAGLPEDLGLQQVAIHWG